MRIRFVWVGKTKDKSIATLTDEYLKRIGHFTTVDVSIVKEQKADEADSARIIENESEAIARAIPPGAYAVLLDIEGRQFSSPDLAGFIANRQQDGTKELIFIIGGFLGVSQHLKESVRQRLSLSRLTLTHELARVVLAEQIYRAFTILHGLPYQK
ncbi:MAG TPA: 23S rRNA (pseudouridine(1915)-N(3))-methyltransferase RlmH [Blastocatellia bacterium]|nr:23S rRNA (pseudouridine(1915)-N(3))-methyltransferase RlmH [Blastocatellia bacterium]